MADIVEAAVVAGMSGTILLLCSSLFLYRGWRRRARYRNLRDARPDSVDHLTPGTTTLLAGDVRPTDDTVSAPLSETEAVLSATAVDEWLKTLRFRGWHFAAHSLTTPGFTLRTDSGDVSVPAYSHANGTNRMGFALEEMREDAVVGRTIGNVAVEVDTFETEFEVGPDETRSERVAAFDRRVGLEEPRTASIIDLLGRADGTRRYRELAVEPGQTVTVYGTVVASDSADIALGVPDDGSLLVSTLPPDDLLRRYRRRYLPWLYLPSALVVGGTLLTFAVLVV